MVILIELFWQTMARFAANHTNPSYMSLVEASRLCIGRFAADRANTTSVFLIRWSTARSAFDCASASSGYGTVGLFADASSVSSQTAAALAIRHTTRATTSSILESISEGLCCRFCLKRDMLPPFARYVYTFLTMNALRVVQPFAASLWVVFFHQSVVCELLVYIGNLFVVLWRFFPVFSFRCSGRKYEGRNTKYRCCTASTEALTSSSLVALFESLLSIYMTARSESLPKI